MYVVDYILKEHNHHNPEEWNIV